MRLERLPGVAEVAMQSGRHAASTIVRRASGDTVQPTFRYRDLGTAATISRYHAVVYVGRFRVGGLLGWLVWLVAHLTFLTGFKSRFATLAAWAVTFLGRGRPERTITRQQALALARAGQSRAATGAQADAPRGASPRAA